MPIRNPEAIEVKDEGVSQGRARIFDYVGAGVSAAVSGQTATVTIAGGGAGSFAPTIVEVDLGAGLSSGAFDITGLSGLTTGKSVYIQQAAGPYTDKGDLADEAEMDLVWVTGYVVDAATIRCFWDSEPASMAGLVKFQYIAGA